MAVTVWDVEGHAVHLWHSAWTGRARIAVDSHVVFSRSWLWTDPGFSHRFRVGETSCRVQATNRLFGYRYELLVGGESAKTVAPRERRRLPISLRMFLVMLVTTAIVSSSWILIRAERQRAAVARMQWYYATIGSIPHGPRWLRDWLGDRWEYLFKDVVDVELDRTEVADEDLGELEKLPSLRKLSLVDAPFITDSGIVHLRGLKSLRDLNLDGTQVSDAGLVHLAGLTGLESLVLGNTTVTDSGLSTIGTLPALWSLYLDKTAITDDGIRNLTGLRKLAILWLDETLVTGASFAHLKKFPNLSSVSLSGAPVTDDGSEDLKELTDLEELDLSGTRITNATLIALYPLTNLRRLNVIGTQVTDSGVADLQRAHPKLKILRNDEVPEKR